MKPRYIYIYSSMLLKETWSPTRSSCFVVIFHNKEVLSLNISMVMYFDNAIYMKP